MRPVWAHPDASARQLGFIQECLADLREQVSAFGGRLLVLQGEACEALERFHASSPFDALLAHEETGNGPTYERDLAVAAWCRQRGITFEEWPQNGVVRRLRSRDGWARLWDARMSAPTLPPPRSCLRSESHSRLPTSLPPGSPPPHWWRMRFSTTTKR